MNFKIEINYLNIDNYPILEKYFEDMASKSWFIDRIFMGTFFIFKKIEPQQFDFSISPYEIETGLSRKSKAELNEFHEVSKSVGWDYATKSYDLHIYYKSKDTDAVHLHTDEEEEFNTLEIIGKRYLRTQYFLLPLLLLLSWWNIGGMFSSITSMKNGYGQISAFLLPIGFLIAILHIFDLKRFFNRNRKNIENGYPLEFNHSTHKLYKVLFTLASLIFLVLFLYLIYTATVLNNFIAIAALLPVILGFSIAFFFRMKIKPLLTSKLSQLISIVAILIFAFIMGEQLNLARFIEITEGDNVVEPSNYKVLSHDSFSFEEKETDGDLTKNASFLIPISYNYTSEDQENNQIRTEYSKVLNENLAQNLIDLYLQQGTNRVRVHTIDVESSLIDGVYNHHLADVGFSKQDFEELQEIDLETDFESIGDRAAEILIASSIQEDNDLWDLDEVYFLSNNKDEIVIRKGKEVFYLLGLDFSDPIVINQAKEQLNLN